MILWSEWYNVPNDTMILMIQCTKWFEWYNGLTDRQKWISRMLKKFNVYEMIKMILWSEWYNVQYEYDWNDTVIQMIKWSELYEKMN